MGNGQWGESRGQAAGKGEGKEKSLPSPGFRELPSIREVLEAPEIAALSQKFPRWALLEASRGAVAARRQELKAGAEAFSPLAAEEIEARARALLTPSLRPVINATGVVLHTNLGRAPLAEEVIQWVAKVSRGYSTLEFDLERGERGSRHAHVARLAATLCGAEDAAVVNNNAAAVLLTLSALAAQKSVLVSRGELVEIGGSFRIPEILALSGARLLEVGATNRTHLADYERAFSEEVALLLKVHRSNFALVGFVTEPSRQDLVALAHRHGCPVVEDLGSGCLVKEPFGGFVEPTPNEALRAGVDIVTISGDKLLGGPQAGIILGKRDLIARIKKHPLARAVRVDKMTLAALEATLALYRDGRAEALPMLSMLRASQPLLLKRARRLASALRKACPRGDFRVEKVIERVGGGALPLAELAGAAVSCQVAPLRTQALEERLRHATPPLIVRIERDRLFLHLRTILRPEEPQVVAAFAALS